MKGNPTHCGFCYDRLTHMTAAVTENQMGNHYWACQLCLKKSYKIWKLFVRTARGEWIRIDEWLKPFEDHIKELR